MTKNCLFSLYNSYSDHPVFCNDTTDWVDVPLGSVSSLAPPKEYRPCRLEWTNLQMLQSDQSCIRFTAASGGPIYFALSSVPSNTDTWYYLRISKVDWSYQTFWQTFQDDVTVYKGKTNLDYATDADGAVALGDAKLFQSFIICSEYAQDSDTDIYKTRITYGKIAAGNINWRFNTIFSLARCYLCWRWCAKFLPCLRRWRRTHATLFLFIWLWRVQSTGRW